MHERLHSSQRDTSTASALAPLRMLASVMLMVNSVVLTVVAEMQLSAVVVLENGAGML